MSTLEAIHLFLEWVERYRKPKTSEWYSHHLMRGVHLHEVQLSDLRPYHLVDFLEGQGWSQSYRASCVTAWRRFANWCVERELIASNPFLKVKRPPLGTRAKIPSLEQVEAILCASRGPARTILFCLAHTGARPFELRLAQADWYRPGLIEVPRSVSKGARRRVVLLPDDVDQIVRGLASGGFIFKNHRGVPWTNNSLLLAMKRACKRAGVPHFPPYSLRHAFATKMVGKLDAVVTAKLLGHSDVSMVHKVYSRPSDERLRELLNSSL